MEKKIVDIFDISYEGSGVGKLDGQIVFVPKTLCGEEVEIEILKKTKNFLLAKQQKVIEESDERIMPFCPYFDICGGCAFQHCDYNHEKIIKTQILKNELKKVNYVGEIDFIESETRFAYRNKIKLEVRQNELGYFKQKSHEFFAIDFCPIAKNEINAAIPKVKEFLKINDFKNLKSVYFKQVEKSVAIVCLFDKNDKKVLKNIKNIEILSNFSVFFAFGDILESNSTQIFNVFGKEKLQELLDDNVVEIDVSSFNQVNENVAEKLYENLTNIVAGKRVVNAYSGQGLLTYKMAKFAKFVYGIEYQKSAHKSAEKLKSLNEEYRIENICGKVEDCLDLVLLKDRIDIIVLDPAREGCDQKVLDSILKSDISEIAYVSCNFSTLVRDLKVLQSDFSIEKVKIFDMFPCTANLETLVLLKKKYDS